MLSKNLGVLIHTVFYKLLTNVIRFLKREIFQDILEVMGMFHRSVKITSER